MKKIIGFLAVLLALALFVCSCGQESVQYYEINDENAWTAFPVDKAPVKTVRAGEKWYSLIGRYLHDSFSLSVSEDYGILNEVYSVSGVSIWFFEACESFAVWAEENAAELRFMLYSGKSGEVSEIFSASKEAGFESANVGIFGASVYFAYTDYAAENAAIMRYNTENGELSRFMELDYSGEYSCMSFSVDGESLLVATGKGKNAALIRVNLESGERESITIGASAGFVYACAYDSARGGYAVYYCDADGGEHVGTVNAKNGKIKNIYSFGSNVYAYKDTLEFYGGHLYWVRQINASGNVAEHYSFVDYDLESDTADEYLRTFSFSLCGDGAVLLSFNSLNYDAIYLTEIYLGGQ